MTGPLQITLHGVTPSVTLERDIRRKAGALRRVCREIVSCRVVVERPHLHRHRGAQFVVRLHLAVPGREIVVNHDHDADARVAVRDAFRAARRQLEGHVRRRDGGAKSRRAARTAARSGRGIPA